MPRSAWILLAIIVLGIFLRTYHFSAWMVFNPDQARDAMLVDDVLSGKSSALILGPEAGNTLFDLGPWFYHLEILSAKFFGSEPWKLALPDLLFSLLTIPLFYFFVRKYFNLNVSLTMMFFVSISYFMVRYSRFAFNPNSIPFFLLLFLCGVLCLLEKNNKKSFAGAALIGVAIGVGMQLHILLFFIMPTVTGVFFLYLLFKKPSVWPFFGKIVVIVFFILLANAGQIAYGLKNGWLNNERFRLAITDSTGGGSISRNLSMDLLCQSQANLHIISSLGDSEECTFYKVYHRATTKGLSGLRQEDNATFILMLFGVVYSLGGYILLGYFWYKETDERRKNWLSLAGIYGLVSLVAMLPIITQASLRYYIISFFLPFIFLGVWVQFFLGIANREIRRFAIFAIVAGFVFFQFQKLNSVRADFENQHASDERYAIWGEVENMTSYIAQNSSGEDVYIAGKNAYFSRFYKPLLYAGGQVGVNIQRGDKSEEIPAGAHIIFIQDAASSQKMNSKKTFMGHSVENYKIFGNVAVINLKK